MTKLRNIPGMAHRPCTVCAMVGPSVALLYSPLQYATATATTTASSCPPSMTLSTSPPLRPAPAPSPPHLPTPAGPWKTSLEARPTSWRQFVAVYQSDTSGHIQSVLGAATAGGGLQVAFK